MRRIKIICDAFVICDDDEVIAVVTKCNETQWGVYPLVPCEPVECARYVPLQHALDQAVQLKRK